MVNARPHLRLPDEPFRKVKRFLEITTTTTTVLNSTRHHEELLSVCDAMFAPLSAVQQASSRSWSSSPASWRIHGGKR